MLTPHPHSPDAPGPRPGGVPSRTLRDVHPTDPRRLVILAEGYFGDSHAKTAYGVIRFGRDEVVAVLDSEQAGRDCRRVPAGHPAPIVATLAEALA